ncbi:hypothetical protein CBF34_03530 [Vagococcus penaei]|uniref:Uncharacterized protein n=1 Tax=Vagococcus penaei TaxID=633807 RepID=A0A1Q2D7E5_9ENTE|nr:GtrA family protein [Vagococcus penaei]AQP54277.1 hypothetical protein BW732_08600 [Vagococcus penaei]RSU05838.1 hypothetical protein CBF34_03530 [Vagococcus penaei]
MIRRNEFLLYVVFGVLGTLIYFFTRFTTREVTTNVLLPVIVGQVVALLFAFFANKYIVFKNSHVGWRHSITQFFEFLLTRVGVFLLDLGIAYIFVEKYQRFWIKALHLKQLNYHHVFFANPLVSRYIGNAQLLNEFLFTILSQSLAAIINYVISKRVVFNIKQTHEPIHQRYEITR